MRVEFFKSICIKFLEQCFQIVLSKLLIPEINFITINHLKNILIFGQHIIS